MLWPYTSVYPAHAQSLGCVWLCDPMDCSPPGFSIHRTFQARIWSGSPFPSPGDLPDPAIKLASPALADRFFILSHLGSPCFCVYETIFYDNVYVEKTIIMRWPVTLFHLFKCWLQPTKLISRPSIGQFEKHCSREIDLDNSIIEDNKMNKLVREVRSKESLSFNLYFLPSSSVVSPHLFYSLIFHKHLILSSPISTAYQLI